MMTAPHLPGVALQIRQVYDRNPSVFQPVGPHSKAIATLGWTLIVAATVVFIVVMTLLLLPIWKRRHASVEDGPPAPVSETAWLLYAGTLAPAAILAGVFVLTLGAYHAARPSGTGGLTIEVVGHQWWWEVRYPDEHILTANEIHIPVGREVRVVLTSADVIHSFWVPNLAGKTDLIPGTTNIAWIEADTSGTWRGTCAEYCGMQHAHMALTVVAELPGDFNRWTEAQRGVSAAPTDSATLDGEAAFLSSQCVYCHTVRGTQASGRIGPDLTHIGSRLTIASGMLANTRGNLGGWIENPDQLKPGTKMPAVPLGAGQLEAIITYLESLK
ncbi:MAG: cytochrome c oxidase subunit II [Gemmatimonadaceae bacterium]